MNSLLDEDVAARDTINELLDDEHETGQKFVLFFQLSYVTQTFAHYFFFVTFVSFIPYFLLLVFGILVTLVA